MVWRLIRRDCRAIIYYNFSRGSSKEECFKKISGVFSENRPSIKAVKCWYLQFRRGSFVLKDQPHTGRPSDVVSPELVDSVRKAIKLNKRITYRELEEILHISKSTLQRIVLEQLSVRKLCTLEVTHPLFDQQQENRRIV